MSTKKDKDLYKFTGGMPSAFDGIEFENINDDYKADDKEITPEKIENGDVEKPIPVVKKTSQVIKPIAKKETEKVVAKKTSEFKLMAFSTENEMVQKFVDLSPKLYIRLKLKQNLQTFYHVFHLILKNMKADYIKKYPALLNPSEDDLAFYKNRHTKSRAHDSIDEIKEKKHLTVKVSLEDYDLVFILMNTFYKNSTRKVTKYSINHFFFEIIRFFESNINSFKK